MSVAESLLFEIFCSFFVDAVVVVGAVVIIVVFVITVNCYFVVRSIEIFLICVIFR